MFLNKYKNLIKIIIILVTAYFVSIFFIKDIFLADSPIIRPNLEEYYLTKINNIKESLVAKFNFSSNNNFAAKNNQEQIATFLKNNLKPIVKGVSAVTKDNNNYTEYDLNQIVWEKITFTLRNGKVITIEYPKGTNPPVKEDYEN